MPERQRRDRVRAVRQDVIVRLRGRGGRGGVRVGEAMEALFARGERGRQRWGQSDEAGEGQND